MSTHAVERSEIQGARDIRTLSYAEHFLIWALRTSVACSTQCRTLHREFSHAFGVQMDEGIIAFHKTLTLLARGRRKMLLGRPGHIETTTDELSLLALFAAAQKGDEVRFLAHGRWIMGAEPPEALYAATRVMVQLLGGRGYALRDLCLPAVGRPQVPAVALRMVR
ncbi:MAG: hypothetical protein QM645_09510 [Asticcacaulis sp.]